MIHGVVVEATRAADALRRRQCRRCRRSAYKMMLRYGAALACSCHSRRQDADAALRFIAAVASMPPLITRAVTMPQPPFSAQRG